MKKRYPFKFLDAYTKADTDIFFGRDEEIEALYKMVFQTNILLVYGASGTGKTSLVQCGLASRFQAHDWLDLHIRRGANINKSLEKALNDAGGSVTSDEDLDWLDNLDDEEEEIKMTDLERQFKQIYSNTFRPIYLIFDQFEELFILGNKEEQTQFIATVQEIATLKQPIKMIFLIREEYLGHLYEFEKAVPQLLRKKIRIEPMHLEKVTQVLQGVTTVTNSNIFIPKSELKTFSETVFEKLKGKDKSGQTKKTLTIELPYLQVFLDKVYLTLTQDDSRQTDATFDLAALSTVGEIDDVLRDFLEEQVQRIYGELKPTYPNLTIAIIWKILSPFVTLEGTKEPINQAQIEAAAKKESKKITFVTPLLQAFLKSQILRYDDVDDLYEVAHDALAAKIAEKRSDEEIALLEVKRLIKSQATVAASARELFTEKQINFIEPYLVQLDLSTTEQTLIEESKQAATLKRAAKKRSRQVMITIVTIVLAIMTGLTVWAFWQQGIAEQQKTEAQTNLKNAYQSEIKRYEREQKIAEDNKDFFERLNAEPQIIQLEQLKIDSFQQKITTLNQKIATLN